MTTLAMVAVAIIVWPLVAVGVARGLQGLARVTADRLTRRGVR